MTNVTYCAVLLNAKTDGNEIFEFEAGEDLFRMPARDIVSKFIKHLINEGGNLTPVTYKLDSVVKKDARKILMATGSLTAATGETSFTLMISPRIRERSN